MSMNGLDRITERILSEAREEADRILEDAETKCAQIASEAEVRAAEIRARLNEDAERDATELVSRIKTAVETKKRNALLMTQSALLDEVFDDTLAQIYNLEAEKYTEILVGLLCAALIEQREAEQTSRNLYGEEDAMAPDAYEVLLNQRDYNRCGKVLVARTKQKLDGKLPAEMLDRLTVSEQTVGIDGGLILRCGSVESNCSLRPLFAQLREELETEVSRALFGTSDHP